MTARSIELSEEEKIAGALVKMTGPARVRIVAFLEAAENLSENARALRIAKVEYKHLKQQHKALYELYGRAYRAIQDKGAP